LWIYSTSNFEIARASDFCPQEIGGKFGFVRVTPENYVRVADFRNEDRVAEYRNKLAHEEIGFFAELGGKMVGSIWATINRAQVAAVVRGHMRLMFGEALIHDIVTGEEFRGQGVGPFMVGRMASALLNEFRVSKIIIDVSAKNNSSLRMMEKVGLQAREKVLSVSVLGKLAFEKVLKSYA